MIIGFYGDPRAGKTLSAVKEVYELWEESGRRRKIYSNIKLSIPYEPLTLDMVLDIVENDIELPDDPIFLIDEIYLWLDARSSLSNVSKYVSWFLMQTGKLGVNTDIGMILIYTSQYPELIDNRLWVVSNIKVFCQKMEIMQYKFIIQTIILKQMSGLSSHKAIVDAQEWYMLYNTRERVLTVATERFKKGK